MPPLLLFVVGLGAALIAVLLVAWPLLRRRVLITADGVGVVPDLRDPVLQVGGRPDGILAERRWWGGLRFIPLEFKPLQQRTQPLPSDLLQLSLYVVLARRQWKSAFAGYGILRYAGADFTVRWSQALEREVFAAIEQYRADRERADPPPRSHNQPSRCRSCRAKGVCDAALPSGNGQRGP